MEISFLSILALGFVLGIKHAIEPDHVIAVSTIASQSKKLLRCLVELECFGALAILQHYSSVGVILIFMKGEIPEKWLCP